MVDTVKSVYNFGGTSTENRRHYLRLLNTSDSTGESAVTKLDISAFTLPSGDAATKINIQEISWDVQGFEAIKLSWDATTDDDINIMSGQGYEDYRDLGGLKNSLATGWNGDLLLSTLGTAMSGDTYSVLIHFTID